MLAPKGGAGKSTSAVLLATELAAARRERHRYRRRPQQARIPLGKASGAKPDNLTVLADVTEDSIIDEIERAATRSAFVIVDLEGTASMMVGYAIKPRRSRDHPDPRLAA